METVIEIENLHKNYKTGQDEVAALKGVDLSVKRGEILGIIGSSGAGKSTLARCINALERPDSGSVRVAGQDILKLKGRELLLLRRKIGVIFQNFNLLRQKTVLKNVLFPLEIAGVKKSEATERALELLKEVNLADKVTAYPAQLSGGQKQRVAIARALALDPEVLICDEATSALDPETTAQILSLIKAVNEKRALTIVVISHQINVVKSLCTRIAVLDNGVICETGETMSLLSNPQSDAAKRLLTYEGGF
ncbi:MAG: ATP-binding cassette domain-containing protein [Clostridiales bacterium]|nr:ATP-binding cassette domain-containing protein [Clostridiales bacterium]